MSTLAEIADKAFKDCINKKTPMAATFVTVAACCLITLRRHQHGDDSSLSQSARCVSDVLESMTDYDAGKSLPQLRSRAFKQALRTMGIRQDRESFRRFFAAAMSQPES